MSGYPPDAATEFTTSSGAEVPKATMVSPMAKSETLYFFARTEAPSTNQSAPLTNRSRPRINNRN